MIKCIKKFIRLIKRMIIKVNKMKNEYIEESKEKIVEQKKSEQEQVVLELDNNENNEENCNLELRINETDKIVTAVNDVYSEIKRSYQQIVIMKIKMIMDKGKIK